MSFHAQILVLAEDPSVRRTKQLVLQELGFDVIAVGTLREVEFVISRSVFDLAILGRSLSAEHKRQAASVIRTKLPNTPLLELCDQQACVDDPDYVLQGHNPEDLAVIVKEIFSGDKPKRG